MNVLVNGKSVETDRATLNDLLQSLGYDQGAFVVAVNFECVPKSQHGATPIREGDQVEILAPMAGG